jgi:hypothetical protein
MTAIRLSKSRLMSGAQCVKRLWLEMHEPWRAQIDAAAQAGFATGHRVGEVARSLHPEGRLIGHVDDLAAALAETQSALAADGDLVLFEPALSHGDVLIRADLLFRRDGRYRLVEVKATTGVKDHHLHDAAIQAWVIGGAGYPLDSVSIAHVHNSFVYTGGDDYRGLVKSVDVTQDIAAPCGEVPHLLARCQQAVAGPMPEVNVGKQCNSPYPCPFSAWCNRGRPEYPLSILGNPGLRKRLAGQGYRDVRDVPAGAIDDGMPRHIWSAVVTGVPFTDPRAADVLRDLPYPRYYLDFETVQFAVPIWPGTRPYEQLPFQWSCTIEHPDGTLEHREFLDTSGEAPMRPCLQALVESIGFDGPVFSYTDLEGRVLREGGARYPDLAPALDALAIRLVDLYPIARAHYYHPAQNGSWSIKRLLPTIAPDLDYANLDEVADGTSAQLAYLEMVDPATADERRTRLAAALRVYCRRDTEGMVRIVQHLTATATISPCH